MIGPALILFLAGDTIEGVVQLPSGRRERLSIAASSTPNPSEARTWLLSNEGPKAAPQPFERQSWIQRFSDALIRTRSQVGQAPAMLRLIVPPGLAEATQAGLVVAGHLAGFARVDCLGLDQCLDTAGHNLDGQHQTIVCWGAAGCRMWSFKAAPGGSQDLTFSDLSEKLAFCRQADLLVTRMDISEPDRAAAAQVIGAALAHPVAEAPSQIYVARDQGPPLALFIGADLRTELLDQAVSAIGQALTRSGGALLPGAGLHLFGPLAGALGKRFAIAHPAIAVFTAPELSAPLEVSPIPDFSIACLSGRVSVSTGIGSRLSGSPVTEAIALAIGEPLPQSRVFESFHTAGMINSFSLQYQEGDGRPFEIGQINLPLLLETKPFSRLRLKVLADTDLFIVVAVSVADGLIDETIVYDRQKSSRESIASNEIRSGTGRSDAENLEFETRDET